jgi:hypothetical protein
MTVRSPPISRQKWRLIRDAGEYLDELRLLIGDERDHSSSGDPVHGFTPGWLRA